MSASFQLEVVRVKGTSEVRTKRWTEGVFWAASRALRAPAIEGVMTALGSPTSKARTEATWATPETSVLVLMGVSGVMERSRTFGDFIVCSGSDHIFHHHGFVFPCAVLLVEKLLQPTGFGGISNRSSDFVASFQELVGDMTSDVSIRACHQDG